MSVVALCGGIGGAKLALGLYRVLPPGELTVVGNTGDDFEHLGLAVSPDLDTICYTLGGLADRERGWGRGDESWNFMEAVSALGGPDWFSLGDRDLALHVLRSAARREGQSLGGFTAQVARSFGIEAQILPMSDDRVSTLVETDSGTLGFQDYFVRHRCAPAVRELRYHGAEAAEAGPGVLAALTSTETRAIVICPSNPFLSIDPILAVPGIRAALRAATAPVVAISPLIGAAAVKGPTVEIMRTLGLPVTARAICDHYGDFLDALVIDEADAQEADALPVAAAVTRTYMSSLEDRENLANFTLDFARRIAAS